MGDPCLTDCVSRQAGKTEDGRGDGEMGRGVMGREGCFFNKFLTLICL